MRSPYRSQVKIYKQNFQHTETKNFTIAEHKVRKLRRESRERVPPTNNHKINCVLNLQGYMLVKSHVQHGGGGGWQAIHAIYMCQSIVIVSQRSAQAKTAKQVISR